VSSFVLLHYPSLFYLESLFFCLKNVNFVSIFFLGMLVRVFGEHRFSLELWVACFSLFVNPEKKSM